jgi:hypothetical protein
MSLGPRDSAAYELASRRAFGEGTYATCVLVALDLDMQTRRLTMRLYGTLRSALIGEPKSYLSTVTFFAVSALKLGVDSEDGAFPESATVEALSLSYDDEADEGHAHVTGSRGWSIDFVFDGIAFEETPATIASLVDDDA